MSSILNNSAALSALQALQMTQQSLATVQNQVSTGLSVATAADNSAYWSIAAQLNQDNGVVQATNTALTEGQSVLSTATSAINSVITTLNSMATALTEAQNPGANLTSINTSLASLGQQLTDAVNNASFNGLNILNNSVTTVLGGGATGVSFVSGYNATSNGGTVNTIDLATQALYIDASANPAQTAAAYVPATGAGDMLFATGAATGATAVDLTQIGGTGAGAISTSAGAANALGAVNAALTNITNYAASIGATQNRMTAASTFNTSLSTNYLNGVSGLVDADMNTASTRLQALQTQEQLGIQSLSVANQNAALILKLFG